MAYRRVPFQVDEWFHCYNRGIDKRLVFESEDDAERFLKLLYAANSTDEVRLGNLSDKTEKVLAHARPKTLVVIGAYCLMPNHYHLLLKETSEGGITKFMQKLGTAYTMFFNTKYERTGNLFVKPFRSRHIHSDGYFQRVVDYIHCNPIELFEAGWKKGVVKNVHQLERKLGAYRYSSFPDYYGEKRVLTSILGSDVHEVYRATTARKMLEAARAYYASIMKEDPDIARYTAQSKLR